MTERIAAARRAAAKRQARCRRLKELIVARLDLPIPAQWITDDQPLVGRGLELDSVDTLELMLGIDAEFGVSITDDEIGVFGSVSRVVDRIESDPTFEDADDAGDALDVEPPRGGSAGQGESSADEETLRREPTGSDDGPGEGEQQ